MFAFQSPVRYLSKFFFGGVPQGSVLGLLLFSTFINDLSSVIKHSVYLLFADSVKIFHAVSSVDDCILPQSYIERIQSRCTADFMKLNSSKTRVITFIRKMNVLHYTYKLWDSSITLTDTIKDLGVQS